MKYDLFTCTCAKVEGLQTHNYDARASNGGTYLTKFMLLSEPELFVSITLQRVQKVSHSWRNSGVLNGMPASEQGYKVLASMATLSPSLCTYCLTNDMPALNVLLHSVA